MLAVAMPALTERERGCWNTAAISTGSTALGGQLEDWSICRPDQPATLSIATAFARGLARAALPLRDRALHEAALQAYGTRASHCRPCRRTSRDSIAAAIVVTRAGADSLAESMNMRPSASCGLDVADVADLKSLAGADLAVVVNPNNPAGRRHERANCLRFCPRWSAVVDESFADATPELSLAPEAGRSGLLILRSFGKFYGLAG